MFFANRSQRHRFLTIYIEKPHIVGKPNETKSSFRLKRLKNHGPLVGVMSLLCSVVSRVDMRTLCSFSISRFERFQVAYVNIVEVRLYFDVLKGLNSGIYFLLSTNVRFALTLSLSEWNPLPRKGWNGSTSIRGFLRPLAP